jgi:hypothetical protein
MFFPIGSSPPFSSVPPFSTPDTSSTDPTVTTIIGACIFSSPTVSECFKTCLQELNQLESGKRLVQALSHIFTSNPNFKIKISEPSPEVYPKPNSVESLQASDILTTGEEFEVTLTLPNPPPENITIPILIKTKSGTYGTKDISVPFFVGVGHELVHIYHKFDMLKECQNPTNIPKLVQDINNWAEHRDHERQMATMFGFAPTPLSLSPSPSSSSLSPSSLSPSPDDDPDMGLMDFENENWTTFQDMWGSIKFYEEFRTITGKESNTLTLTRAEQPALQFSEPPFSERHFLSDHFQQKGMPDMLIGSSGPPFVTRWTHQTSVEEINKSAKPENILSPHIINKIFTSDELDRIPCAPS